MHNVVPFAIEEILSFTPGNCHACRELHEDLKRALMEYLLATTSIYVQGEDVAASRMKRVESDLDHALAEFEGHRKDTHFVAYITPSWMAMTSRNAS